MEGDSPGVRKTATVEVTDETGRTIRTLEFNNVWLQSVEISTLKARATESAPRSSLSALTVDRGI